MLLGIFPFDLFPFTVSVSATAVAGTALWALALYLGFSPVSDWVMVQLNRWFNFAEQFLYTSEAEYERTRQGRESQNAFLASLVSIVPFLVVGGLCNYGVDVSLGPSWGISTGMIAGICGGIYELGRRNSQDSV
jgi:hypothetical protein